MKWLHLSDFNISSKQVSYNTSNLIKDLKTYIEKNISVDHVFYTGDFRFASNRRRDTAEADAQSAADQLVEIASLAGVGLNNIHIVPGNHDLDRWDTAVWAAAGKTKESFMDLNDKAKKTIKLILKQYNGSFAGEILHNGEFEYPKKVASIDYLANRFSFFKLVSDNLQNTVWTGDVLFRQLHFVREYEGLYNIAYLNTAIAGGLGRDHGNLVVGHKHFSQALDGINTLLPGIALGHHRLDALRRADQARLRAIFLENNISLYLCGDGHMGGIEAYDGVLQLAAGCLIQNNDVVPAFYVGSMDESGIQSIEACQYSGGAQTGWMPADQMNGEIRGQTEKLAHILSGETALSKVSDSVGTYSGVGSGYNEDYDTMIEMRQKDLETKIEELGEEHLDTAASYSDIGAAYFQKGDYDRALRMLQKASEIKAKALGEEHPDTAASYNNIGSAYSGKGDFDRALEMHQKSLDIFKAEFGEGHPDTAASYGNIGSAYSGKGDYDRALEMHQKSLDIFFAAFGEGHPDTAVTYSNIGSAYSGKGDYDRALEMHQKSLHILLAAFGEGHPDTAVSYNNIGSAYFHKGDYDRALEMHKKALEIKTKAVGEGHPDTAISYGNLGSAHLRKGDYYTALEMHQMALDIRIKALGEEHLDTASSYANVGSASYHTGDHHTMLSMHKKALEIKIKAFGEVHPDTALSYGDVAFALHCMGDNRAAIRIHLKVLKIKIKLWIKNTGTVFLAKKT
ncbi:MAG: tetratricopeptide repeat protein [Eubacteriaceae bacterium]|nr:tetratricopeptide repeat protein [Eubacteriaceae bacterium]